MPEIDPFGAPGGACPVVGGTSADDHDLLILRGREENAGGLVPKSRGYIGRNRLKPDWIIADSQNAGLLPTGVVHAPATEEDSAVGEEKQMGVVGKADERSWIVGRRALSPSVG